MADAEQETLTFDKATYEGPTASAMPCSSCKASLEEQYWKLGPYVLCEKCRGSVAAQFAKSKSGSAFGKAVLLGGLTALGCGIAYAVFVGLTKMQLALLTIGIAYVIATVVRRASGGFSGRRFQVLAVVLTYFASTMGYIPGIFAGLAEQSGDHSSAAPSGSVAGSEHPAEPAHPAEAEKHAPVSAVAFVVALVFLVGIMLVAPFLELTSAPIGFLIIAFGLWEAWRRSRGVPLSLEGPFRVA
jgi:hypothetical protein